MKTSVIEMRDMLAVLTVDDVEKRLREIAGVESATVNYAAGNATVRYDETLLEVADIKVLVRQRGKQSSGDEKQEKAVSDAPPSAAVADKPVPPPDEPVSAASPVASVGGDASGQASPIALPTSPPSAEPSTPVATEPKPATDASAATPASAPSTPATVKQTPLGGLLAFDLYLGIH